MDRALLEEQLAGLPLYIYQFMDPASLEFSQRVRYICRTECPMYGKSWACPPGVGEVEVCRSKCMSYKNCLLVGTIVEATIVKNEITKYLLDFCNIFLIFM